MNQAIFFFLLKVPNTSFVHAAAPSVAPRHHPTLARISLPLSAMDQPPNYAAIVSMTRDQLWQRYNRSLDWLTPHALARWLGLLAFLFLYGVRVWMLQGFYIVTYALGIFLLNNLIGFVTPQVRWEGCLAGSDRCRRMRCPCPPPPPQPSPAPARLQPHAPLHPHAPQFAHAPRLTLTLRAPRCRGTLATTPSRPSRRAWGSSSFGSCPWRALLWPLS